MQTRKIISAATTNAGVIAGQAKLFGAQGHNASGLSVAYLKLYDKATAPNVGSDIPVLFIAIGINASRDYNRPQGLNFTNGIAYAITGGAADNDNTAVAAAQVVASLEFS